MSTTSRPQRWQHPFWKLLLLGGGLGFGLLLALVLSDKLLIDGHFNVLRCAVPVRTVRVVRVDITTVTMISLKIMPFISDVKA